MDAESLSNIVAQVDKQPALPPIEQWQPELNGDIDICIRSDGRWFHEGSEIRRQPLVNLFASILRREQDGEYYLVTPVEKWRIQVEEYPLQAVDFTESEEGGQTVMRFKLNTGSVFTLSALYPITIRRTADGEPVPYLQLHRGLSAKLSRNCFYRLIEEAVVVGGIATIASAGQRFDLGAVE